GVPAAAVVDRDLRARPAYRQQLDALADRAASLEDEPRLFDTEQIWDLQEFLRSGRVLLVAIDGDRGRSLIVVGDDMAIRLATGPLTLARVTGATVVPCLMVALPGLRAIAHFGKPVPATLVADRSEHRAALGHIIETFRTVLRAYPEQCSWELLRRIEPA